MRALVLVALAGCVVVRPPRVDERPRWRITNDNPHELGCASARALVRKSGKQGIGIALQFKSRAACTIDFTMARIALDDNTLVDVPLPPSQQLPERSLVYAWWPVKFDNNRAWNAGYRTGSRIQIGDWVDGKAKVWEIPMEQL